MIHPILDIHHPGDHQFKGLKTLFPEYTRDNCITPVSADQIVFGVSEKLCTIPVDHLVATVAATNNQLNPSETQVTPGTITFPLEFFLEKTARSNRTNLECR